MLFVCTRMIKSCCNAYVLSSFEYCVPVCMSSAESHLGLLDSIVRVICSHRYSMLSILFKRLLNCASVLFLL